MKYKCPELEQMKRLADEFFEKADDFIKKQKIVHVNPNCKDATRCKPHGETGTVEYNI